MLLDINGLVGNSLPVKIPEVVVKWITYLLFLHVVALAAAAGSAFFGLLAHVREMSMACCSTCFSGFAAVVTLIAFIFDLVLFFVAKSRINAIGYAQIGNAIWLTLAAWVLLFFSGCFYTLGRCCIRGRPSAGGGGGNWFGGNRGAEGPDKNYAEQVRLDAVKAEADRKARQKQGEIGLPAFYESQPLTGHVEGDQVYVDGESNQSSANLAPQPPSRQQSTNFKGGYAPGPTGTRTMDEYYRNNNVAASTGYPPQPAPRRQQSEYSTSSVPTSTSPPIGYTSGYVQYNAPHTTSPPPLHNQLLAPPGHQPYGTQTPDPFGREYGHTAGGTSCKYCSLSVFFLQTPPPDHTAVSHDQGPSSYVQPYEPLHDPYATYQPQPTQQHPSYHPDPYMTTFASPPPVPHTLSTDASHYPPLTISPPPVQHPQPLHGERSYTLGGEHPQPLHGERSYTLGGDGYGTSGDGYGGNQLPPLPEHRTLPPIDTNTDPGYIIGQSLYTSPVKGPLPDPNEAPPVYEPSGPGGVVGNWGKR